MSERLFMPDLLAFTAGMFAARKSIHKLILIKKINFNINEVVSSHHLLQFISMQSYLYHSYKLFL